MTNLISKNKEVEKLNKVIAIFEQLFSETENTLLVAGADEPFYEASAIDNKAQIHSRDDYLSSALHEVAHWCIAGKEKRQLDDFGYWYEAEGRTLEQQLLFEQVEVKPQAIECLLSIACNQRFHFSADNLSQELDASDSFKQAVYQQASDYLQNGLPRRARYLFNELNIAFRHGVDLTLSELEFINV